MKDTDHRVRHPRVHLDDRATAQRTRGCAWRDDQFGRGQNTVLGWSDPTFAHDSVAKVSRGSLQPNQSDERSKRFVGQTGVRAMRSFPVAPEGHPLCSSSSSTFEVEVKRSFTPLLHRGLRQSLHGGRGAMVRQINPMHAPKRTELHADRNDARAGATPPFDVRCVTGFVRSLPPSQVLRANA